MAGLILLLPILQVTPLFAFQQVSEDDAVVRDQEYLHSLNERVANLLVAGEMESVHEMIDEALLLSALFNDREEEAKAFINLGNYFLNRNQPDSVFHHVTEPYERLKDTSVGLRLGNVIANAHARSNNPTASLVLQEELLARATAEGNTYFIAGITQNMANNYKYLGDLNSAIEHYLISLEMAEEMADSSILAVVLDNLGNLNTDMGNLELAETYITQALEIAISLGYLRNQLTSHLNLGIVQNNAGKYVEAEQNFKKVLEISDQLGNIQGRVQGLFNLGQLYSNMGDYETALNNYEASLSLGQEFNIPIARYYNQGGRAAVFDAQGDLERSIIYYHDALDIAEGMRASSLIVPTLKNLYDVYARSGDTINAFTYLKQYSDLQDSLAKLEQEQAVARQEVLLGLRTERETRELTERALAQEQYARKIITSLLVLLLIILAGLLILIFFKLRDNKLLKSHARELAKANEDKDRLLSVLSHDLRTPITSIQGVIELIRSNLIGEEELNAALNQIDVKLQKEYNTLTNYLQWAQNQKGGFKANMALVDLAEINEQIVSEIRKVADNKGVTVENNLPDSLMIYADRQMVFVMLRNLISNSVKYTPKNGSVIINVVEKEERITYSVKDSGSGIPPENQIHVFEPFHTSTPGTDGEPGTGLGLAVCKEFAEKQGAEIYLESESGKGATFYVDFRIPVNGHRIQTEAEVTA